MFDVEALVADLKASMAEGDVRAAARDVLARALVRPAEVAAAIAPAAGGLTLLHHEPDLTVINIAWAPGMRLLPHDHRMWAIIGIYDGVEDNQFYRRDGETLAETTGKRLTTGDITTLGTATIHAVANPSSRLTGAIHVYGGDFVNEPRSQWGPDDLVERTFDMEVVTRTFADANAAAGL